MKLPAWTRPIPLQKTAYGSGPLQKKLWKLTSDYCRIRDWHQFNGSCVASGEYINHWSEADAGHYKSYGVCNGLFKFYVGNVHMQSKSSNGWGGKVGSAQTGHQFAEELKRRYGEGHLDMLDRINREHLGEKFTIETILNAMRSVIELMEDLPEQPAYYQRVIKAYD